MINTESGEVKIQKTIMPKPVLWWNIVLFLVIGVILFLLFGSLFWGIVLMLLSFAASVFFGLIAEEVVDFHAILLLDPFKKGRRVIFPGLHPKLPWEELEEGSKRSLRQVISSVGEENLPTNDPAENMKVHLTVHLRVDVSGTPKEAAENFVRFHSIEPETLKAVVRKEIVKMFSKYYAEHEMESLLDANKIQNDVCANNDSKIKELATRWGVSIGIILDTSNPDEETKKLKRTPARAEALLKSTEILKRKGEDGTGLETEQAHRSALLLDETAEYSEERFVLDISAPDLKNLHDVSLIPPGTFGKGKGGHK